MTPLYTKTETHRIPTKWDVRFLDMAKFVAQWSKDPSTKTGAVIVRPDRTIASIGYNGFAKRCSDADYLYEHRDTKYSRVIHCEMNAVLSARERLDGYTLYTWPFMSCDRCAAHVVQAGISVCVAPVTPDALKERWATSISAAEAMFAEAGVTLKLVDYE